MRFITKNGIELLQFGHLAAEEQLLHGITTRSGGTSAGVLNGLNLSYTVGDEEQNVTANRNLLAAAMEAPPEKLVFPKQTHSVNIRIVTSGNYHEPIPDTDALVTAETGLALAVMSADCVTVLLYDPEKRVIAAIHAGWKGTVNGIVRNTVELMKNEFGCRPESILAGIGPSICAENYEVGPEVAEQFRIAFTNAGELLSRFHGDKAHADLWKANRTWLLQQGIPETNIETAGICTYNNPGKFFSARYFKNHTGRFAGCIKMT